MSRDAGTAGRGTDGPQRDTTTRLEALDAIEAEVWHELERATRESRHDWRTPVLATVGGTADGAPEGDARTVVLREVEADERRIVVYTDFRAAKVAQLRRHAIATLIFWSRALSWQLRLRMACEVIDDGLAVSSRWASIRRSAAAQDYLAPQPPGAVLATAVPALEHREYFAMIEARVLSADWLELDRAGHRRARFGDGEARWVQP